MCCPCSLSHFVRLTTACVSSPKRLGCLHWLAHAAGHGHFQAASTSGRSASFVFLRSPQKTTIQKIGDGFHLRHGCQLLALQRVFSAPPLPAQWSSNMTNGTQVYKGPCSRMRPSMMASSVFTRVTLHDVFCDVTSKIIYPPRPAKT